MRLLQVGLLLKTLADTLHAFIESNTHRCLIGAWLLHVPTAVVVQVNPVDKATVITMRLSRVRLNQEKVSHEKSAQGILQLVLHDMQNLKAELVGVVGLLGLFFGVQSWKKLKKRREQLIHTRTLSKIELKKLNHR